jgi:hypothetical protein
VRVLGQERKQVLQPGAGNLEAAITNPRQQGQLNGHRQQISRSPARRSGDAMPTDASRPDSPAAALHPKGPACRENYAVPRCPSQIRKAGRRSCGLPQFAQKVNGRYDLDHDDVVTRMKAHLDQVDHKRDVRAAALDVLRSHGRSAAPRPR